MIPNFNIEPSKLIDKRFKVKKMEYNTYEVDHTTVKGQLRLLAIPTNVYEIPAEVVAQNKVSSDSPLLFIGTQAIVAFTSNNPRAKIKQAIETQYKDAKKVDITKFIIDQPNEPWNEFILQGTPPILLRIKTILTKLEWFEDYTDALGGPSLSASHNITHSVGEATIGEAGLV